MSDPTLFDLEQPRPPAIHAALARWVQTRTQINELTKGYPPHLCWVCSTRPAQVSIPGVQAGVCTVCDGRAKDARGV